MKFKVCTKCLCRLSQTCFGRNRYAKDGMHYYCKLCAALKRKAWYEENKVKAQTSTNNWKAATAAANA